MTRVAWATAIACWMSSVVLIAMALRRLGLARLVFRTPSFHVDDRIPRGLCKLEGTLEPDGPLVLAPFTERPVVYVHAKLRGIGPEGGSPRVLWEKTLIAPARLCGQRSSVTIDLKGAKVLAPREYRQGTLRALVADTKLVPRVLARVGYRTPPPASQFFELEEEVLLPGEKVSVVGEFDGQNPMASTPSFPVVVSSLHPGRILLRVAWGPALALLLALIVALTGLGVVATWCWLS